MDEVVLELGRIAAEERAVARAAARQRAAMQALASAQVAETGRAPAQQPQAASVSKKAVDSRPLLRLAPEFSPSQTSSRTRQGLMLIVGVVALFMYAMIGGFFIYRIMTQP